MHQEQNAAPKGSVCHFQIRIARYERLGGVGNGPAGMKLGGVGKGPAGMKLGGVGKGPAGMKLITGGVGNGPAGMKLGGVGNGPAGIAFAVQAVTISSERMTTLRIFIVPVLI